MNGTLIGNRIGVTLSRRNLEHLIKMLDMQVGNPTLRRHTENDLVVYVTAEENTTHYADREAGPGADYVADISKPPVAADLAGAF